MILPDFCAFVPLKPEYRYKLFLDDVHLFNCTDDGIALISSLEQTQKPHGHASEDEIAEALGHRYSRQYIQSVMDYFTKLGIVYFHRIPLRSLFTLAENDKAREIIEKVALDNNFNLDPCEW